MATLHPLLLPGEGVTDALQRQAAKIKKLQDALKPFAYAVHNDNGDMTITPANREAYVAAYFAMRS